MSDAPISLTVIDGEQTYILKTYPGEYRSLMVLLYDSIYLEDFGECLGMGRCGTCAIIVSETKHPLTTFDRNESVTLEKAGFIEKEIHLACQIVIDEKLDGAVIRIYYPEE